MVFKQTFFVARHPGGQYSIKNHFNDVKIDKWYPFLYHISSLAQKLLLTSIKIIV